MKIKSPFWLQDYLHDQAWGCGECGRVFTVRRLREDFGSFPQCPFCAQAAQNPEEVVRCST